MRSFYLDDMDIAPGEQVKCKANIAAEWLEVEQIYTVVAFGAIRAPNGELFSFPSARFQKVN